MDAAANLSLSHWKDTAETAKKQHAGSVEAWINNERASHCESPGWGPQVCYWSDNNHKAVERRSNNRNIEHSLSTCLRKVQVLTHELKRCRWDTLGLAEVRWTELGEISTDQGHKIWYYREDSKHQYGATFIVWKEAVGDINCTPIPSGLISIQISVRPHNNITVIRV